MNAAALTDLDRAGFRRHGYLVAPGLADIETCNTLAGIAAEHLGQSIAPIEYEIDVDYPGAPAHRKAPGADTARRLLQACARHRAFRQWATGEAVGGILADLFRPGADIMLSQCHHNCVMTKAPGYSSATLWHQDNRYWSFDEENLVTAWLALGDEHRRNGCLRVVPGSHRLSLDPGRFDARLFLRQDLPENKALLSRSKLVELHRGDVLFFHSRLFHAAGRNLTDATKLSVVFTYHEADNKPIAGARSARFPSIPLRGGS